MFFRTSSDTLPVSDEPEELIRDGFTWPHHFVPKNEMLRNRVIENLDKRLSRQGPTEQIFWDLSLMSV